MTCLEIRSAFALAVLSAACAGEMSNTDSTTDPSCQLDSKDEKTPGYPFDVDAFTRDVLPIVTSSCAAGGCHGAPTGNASFTVWASAQPGTCDFGKTFNNVVHQVDLTTPSNSRLIAAVSGGIAGHPFTFPADAQQLATLRSFAESAARTYANGGGGVTPPPGPSPFDYRVFQSAIQPMVERCATAGCHATAAGGFTLKPMPSADPDLSANFVAITSRTDLTSPEKSLIYTQATVVHASGASKTVTSDEAAALLAWIQQAKQNAGSNPNPTCAPISKFNAGVFATDVFPILAGDLDLNAVGGQGHGAGCAATVCHGTDRGPGKFSLPPAADTATKLQNFACFVNLAAPSSSEILACPLNNPGCRNYPHPGQDVLGGATDFNYQRIVGYVLGANADVSPFDFAFFVRKINPIFNDVNAVQGGAQGRSCSDSTSCHGVAVAGQVPPNGSDFAMIPNASDLSRLTFNFVSATGFANFLNAGESSLFLYPTNEIANRTAHPFATGLPHPGGLDFATDSDEARAILTWANGLRPDANGFANNWLVAGDFPATRTSDPTLVDETTVAPAIFDRAGGAFNNGQWDGLFATSAQVDLNAAFARTATSGRAAYAVAYALNTMPRQLVVQMNVTTQNAIRIYIDGVLVAQNDQGGGASTVMTLAPAGPGNKPTRILIKLVQRSTDPTFAFSAQLRDELGQLLTDTTRELVFTLGPHGGI